MAAQPTKSDVSQRDRLRQPVELIARDLDDDLRRAYQVTGHWNDAGQTDRLATAALHRALERLSATGCWGSANRLPSQWLWQIVGHWLECGVLQWRARSKPRGYAGDFEMLSMIVAREICGHPLGAAFDRYFQAQAAPQAVRNRTELVGDAIAALIRQRPTGSIRVVSIGSGPALDLQRACDQLTWQQRQQLHLILLDLDPVALDDANSRLASRIPPGQLQPIRENLFRLAQPVRSRKYLADADILVCTGLFDYLDDDDAAAMLSRFWQALPSGGKAWVFNFAPHNPSRAYMEWIGNWYLNYRTAEQMSRLASQASIPPHQVQIAAEPSGIDLYWQISKPAG